MNYHFVQQEDWNDCGLACLAMLIENYHQRRISINQLKNHLNSIEGKGLSFFTLIEIGANYQLSGEGFTCEIEMLKENAHLCPIILNVQNQQGMSHYVILNKVENETFYLSDPSQNKPLTKFSFEELKAVFLNKILIFRKTGRWKPKLNFAFLFQWVKHFYLYLFLLVILALLANFFWLLSSGFIKIFSKWLSNQQINWWELGIFVVFVLLACFFDFCQDYLSRVLSQKNWNQLLFHFLSQKPEKGIEERILNRNFNTLKENLEFLQLFWNIILKSLTGLIFIPILEIWISRINSLFCFLPVLWMVIILFGKIFVKKKIPDQKLKLKFQSANYQQSLNHYFNFAKEIQNRGLKKVFFKNLIAQDSQVSIISCKIHYYQILIAFCEKFWVKIFYFILLVIVYFSLQIKSLDGGELLYLIILANYLLSLLNQTFDSWLDFLLILNQQQGLEKSLEDVELKNCPLQKIEEISFENLILENQTGVILTINQKFFNSFFVEGDQEIVKNFFWLIFESSLHSKQWKINKQSWRNYENDLFILKSNTELLPGTLAQNLFNWNSDLNPKIFEILNPLIWLEKYQIDFSQQNSEHNFNLQQKQLINFLAAFFSLSKIFIFQDCCSELAEIDQEELLKLFLELKPDSFVIFTSQHSKLERNFCKKLVLDPMI